ncbi:MAG TPA: LolA-related protein [Steroidobacteraceae bacterium]|nr:LolA-related protein [Steroidobacteraceae bacterium]
MRRLLLLSVLLATNTAAFSRALEDFERQLARTPPVSTGFVEYRFSHLLKKPLRSSGTLEYRADGVLTRNVTSPHEEVTEVTGDEVRITRANKPARTFSLERAPQLRVLLGSFRALLDGHLTPLTRDFDVQLTEQAPRWTLTLKPKDARLARQLARINVFGADQRPQCLEALEPDGDGAVTLLEDAPAREDKLPARSEVERACHASGAPLADH